MKGVGFMERKGCCISAVRVVGSSNVSVILSGSRSSLLSCFQFVVRSLLSAGVSSVALLLVLDSEINNVGTDDD